MNILFDMAEIACEAQEQLQAQYEIIRGKPRACSHYELETCGLQTFAKHRALLGETVGEREEVEQECVHMAVHHGWRRIRPALHGYR